MRSFAKRLGFRQRHAWGMRIFLACHNSIQQTIWTMRWRWSSHNNNGNVRIGHGLAEVVVVQEDKQQGALKMRSQVIYPVFTRQLLSIKLSFEWLVGLDERFLKDLLVMLQDVSGLDGYVQPFEEIWSNQWMNSKIWAPFRLERKLIEKFGGRWKEEELQNKYEKDDDMFWFHCPWSWFLIDFPFLIPFNRIVNK